MNKSLLILLLICLSLKLFSWEVRSDSTIFLGAFGNYGFSKIIGYPGDINYMVKPGGGLVFTYNIHQEISLKSGLSFINNGFSVNQKFYDTMGDSIGNYKTYNEYTYLGIPLEFSYNLGRNRFNVYLSAGIEFNFLLKQHTYAKLPSENNGVPINPYDINNKDLYKTFDFGFLFGIGGEYKIKPNIVVFTEVKYYNGLRNFLKNNTEYIFKHRGYSVYAGIRFGIPLRYSII
ncbi:MAG: PorT family protein [Bacteroidales bacterium]|jgi:opacity protein-like surface antigen|nr:PorT family protein [Bacteroidales bacterium]